MPPLALAAGTIKTILQYALPGVASVINRLFFTGTGSTTNAALNTWCGNVAASWNTNMAPLIAPACTLVAVTAEDLTSGTSPVGAWAGSHPGTSSNLIFDPAAAFIVKNLIANRYRGGHPRTYIPGVPSSNQASNGANTWNTTDAAGLLTQWKAFLSAISGSSGPTGYSGMAQSVVPYYSGTTAVTTGVAPHTRGKTKATPLATTTPIYIASNVYNPTIGSQRRRNHQSV